MTFHFVLLFAAAVQSGATKPSDSSLQKASVSDKASATKAEDCGADKTAKALVAPPVEVAKDKALEEKALEGLGLKKVEEKKPENVPALAPAAMETCK